MPLQCRATSSVREAAAAAAVAAADSVTLQRTKSVQASTATAAAHPSSSPDSADASSTTYAAAASGPSSQGGSHAAAPASASSASPDWDGRRVGSGEPPLSVLPHLLTLSLERKLDLTGSANGSAFAWSSYENYALGDCRAGSSASLNVHSSHIDDKSSMRGYQSCRDSPACRLLSLGRALSSANRDVC